MANAANGEPLGYRNAVVLWSAQSTQGTAVTPATAAGLAKAKNTRKSDNKRYRGPGSPNLVARKGGTTSSEWELSYEAVQSGIKTLLLKGVRTGGVLPYFTLGLGYEDDQGSSNKDADQIQDCKVNQLRLGLDVSSGQAPLTASLSGMGGLVTDLTSLARATTSSTPWMSYEAVFTRDAAAYELRSFSLDVAHNLRMDNVIPGAAPTSFVRGWRYLTEQQEVITGSIARYRKLGFNVQADTLPLSDLLVVLTNEDDSATLTITLNSVDFDNERKDEDENGVFWSCDFEAKTWTLT